MSAKGEDYAYIKFYGPYVTEGRIDLGQAGKTLVSLNKWFKKYRREFVKSDNNIVLRAGAIREGSSEIQFFLDFLGSGYGHGAVIALIGGSLLKNFGIRDFFQKFMGTLGEQLALKLFAKGETLTEEKKFAEDGKVKVKLRNIDGKKLIVLGEDWEIYQETGSSLNGFCNLEKGKEEKMTVGFHDAQTRVDRDISELTFEDKEFFQDVNDPEEWARRLSEPFDETKASETKIVGQFVDYYGLAHKYHFSFQARKEQDIYGKQKILCIVDDDKIEEILDLLKPNNRKNVCIKGMATKDREGKIDKIKIEWINEDPDYNPEQTSMV